MTKPTRRYEGSLIDSLKDPKEAAAYLSVHMEDEGKDAEELFLLALRDVARAYGIADVADRTKLGRESLYKTLSGEVDPRLSTLRAILKSVGLKLSVEPKKGKAS